MKENPRITIISNNNDSKAGVVFIINNNNIKEDIENKWNHTIIIKGRVSTIEIRKNEQNYILMNVYMPNDQKGKMETINKIKEHIKTIENPNNLIITEDFNFVTDALICIHTRKKPSKN